MRWNLCIVDHRQESAILVCRSSDCPALPLRTVNLAGLRRTKQTMRAQEVADRLILVRLN